MFRLRARADPPPEHDVKVAYLIRAHHAPNLLERLVRRLAGPEAAKFAKLTPMVPVTLTPRPV